MNRPPKMPKCKPSLALDTNIVQDNMPQMVLPGIFIGSIHAAFNQEALLENGITHILNASRVPATFPRHFTYLSVDLRDREDANILSCIPTTNIFLEAGIDAGGVLIHCFGGRSRSAGFVCAYLMSSRGWSLDKALEVVTAARPVAQINRGFDRQLRAYMETNYDVYASQQLLLRNRINSLQQVRGNLPTSPRISDKFSDSPTKTAESGTSSVNNNAHGHGQKRWRDVNQTVTTDADGNTVIDMGREHEGGDEEDTLRLTAGALQYEAADAAVAAKEYGPQASNVVPVLEGSAPNCRLSRPGSTTVRVIPPLRGLERRYGCVSCGRSLFSMANVVRERSGSTSDGSFKRPSSSGSPSISSVSTLGSPSQGVRRVSWGAKDTAGVGSDECAPQSLGGSGPIVIPAAPKSSRNGQRRTFSFGYDSAEDVPPMGADSKGDSSINEGDSAMVISSSPNDEETKTSVPPLRSLGLVLPSNKTSSGRPQSAEKRRWLARVSLLKADSKESIHTAPDVPDAKAAKLAADDSAVVDHIERGKHPYFYIEYLSWMGREPLGISRDEGELECPGCSKKIGNWSWIDGGTNSAGDVGPPLFKAFRSSVQLADLPLEATPMSTPRLESSNTPRLDLDGANVTDEMELADGSSNMHK
jgi:hypothetical protein